MGYGTSLGTAHEDEISYVMEKGLTDKQFSDRKEINTNSTSGDFQSRFYASDQSTMPLEASRKLADALKQTGSTRVLRKSKNIEDRREDPEDARVNIERQSWPRPDNFPDWARQENVFTINEGLMTGFNADKDFVPELNDNQLSKDAGRDNLKGNQNPDVPLKNIETSYIDKLKAGNEKTLDFLFGKGENDIRPALGHMAETVKNAFTLPGDVYSGKVQAGSVQEIERAFDLAGLMVTGPAPVAAKLADGTLGSFAGVKSRTLPKDKFYEAQNMELDAMHPDDIWDKTGFFRGADQRWKYEIPDKNATLKMDAFDISGREAFETIVPKQKSKQQAFIDWFKNQKDEPPLILRDVLDHPELFKAYPELGTMKVEPLPDYAVKRGSKGMVSGDTIYLAEGHPEYVRSVLLHEIQHGIQHHEGFAYGGNPEQFLPKELPQAEKEFLAIQSKEEPKIAKVLERTGLSIKQFKLAVEAEQNGIMPPAYAERVQFLREEHPTEYKKLHNIVKSETLLKQAKEEAFTKYTRLMGEVEARNVQTRANYTEWFRRMDNPSLSEDVPRHLQINPNDKSAAMSADIPGGFTPFSKRWPNNDNIRPLNEHEEFLKRWDEWHAFGEKMNGKSELDVHRYNQLGKSLADWQGIPYEPLQHDPLNIRGLRKE